MKLGAMIVQTMLLKHVISAQFLRENVQSRLLHVECTVAIVILAGPRSSSPSNDLANAPHDHRREEPPHPIVGRLSEMRRFGNERDLACVEHPTGLEAALTRR